jgi:Na+/H+ antiporter NhaD/arsenite permease-like protein
MEEFLIPIVMFISIAVVFVFYFWFRYRSRAEMQQTIRTALDKGQELTPEIIDRLGQPQAREHADRRRAVIAIAVALAVALFGFILGEDDAVRPLLGIAMFPLTIGIAYLIISRFSEQQPSN